ncbi:MAG: hypothetical protein ABSG53_30130 [Thermoguttaceae bacterium]|jgi:hypothetical protein
MHLKDRFNLSVFPTLVVLALSCTAQLAQAQGNAVHDTNTPFGLNKVIAFYGAPTDIASATFVLSGDWKYWHGRGGVASRGITHQQFLRKSVDEASKFLASLDIAGNPKPAITIDEFGWDYDGGIDRHSAAILNAVHKTKPELKIAVWQMRGPVAPGLAASYRDTVELVMMETYFDLKDAWMIPFQLQTARLNGLIAKTIVGLGIGSESPDLGSYRWTQTEEELDQQLRLIRLVAPESPGVAFFGLDRLGKCPLTRESLDRLCGHFLQIPTDGTGLKPELMKLGKTFVKGYEKPAIFCSSEFVLPYFHSGQDGGPWGSTYQPPVARVLMMNLGVKKASGIKIGLRAPGEGGGVWAEGRLDIPARSVAVGVLPLLSGKNWHGWTGTEIMVVEAPGCEVFNFRDSRYAAK